MTTTLKRPGGEMSHREMHFIWIIDCSGSMAANGKIQSVNEGVKSSLAAMREAAGENPEGRLLVRVVTFADAAAWHVGLATPVESFRWDDVAADGRTAMGEALSLVADALHVDKMGGRGQRPILVLMSDGQPTDDFGGGLKRLMAQPWGQKAVRLAFAIGDDADQECLGKFVGTSEVPVIKVENAAQLKAYIRWVSSVVVRSVSSPASRPDSAGLSNEPLIPLPPPPPPGSDVTGQQF